MEEGKVLLCRGVGRPLGGFPIHLLAAEIGKNYYHGYSAE